MERKLGVSVFSSLFRWGGISPVENDFEWQFERKRHQKWVFLCRQSLIFAENLFGLKIFHSLSFIDRELLCFPPIFYFLLSSALRPRFLLFLFFSFFSFLPFRALIGNSDFSIRYSLSLKEILLSFSSGERMRILFMGQGSK